MDFFDQNINLLKIHKAFEAGDAILSHVRQQNITPEIDENGNISDFIINGKRVYNQHAGELVTEQVAHYLNNPNCLFGGGEFSIGKGKVFAERVIKEAASAIHGAMLRPTPSGESGFLFIFGLIAGFHLEALLEQLDVKMVIIIEPNVQFLEIALTSLDWQKPLERLQQKGGGIRISSENKPTILSSWIANKIRLTHNALSDGSFIFTHYENPIFTETIELMRSQWTHFSTGNGFIEDEIHILRNSLQNLKRNDYRLLSNKTEGVAVKELPVFIVGSGPSLDASFSVLRKFNDRAIIISAGSALPVLLKYGIRPNFHVELERDFEIGDDIRWIQKKHDLSGITLITNNSIDPRVAGAFDHVIFGFREVVAASRLLASSEEIISFTTPTVVNLALRAALAMNFKSIYFFGVDLGSADRDKHHSKGTVHSNEEYAFSGYTEWVYDFQKQMPGIGGKTIYMNENFLWAKSSLELVMHLAPDRYYVNCSNGALLEGTKSINPKRLELAYYPEQISVIETCNKIFEELDLEPAKTRLTSFDRESVVAEFLETSEKVSVVLRKKHLTIFDLYDDLFSILTPAELERAKDKISIVFFRGTIETIFIKLVPIYKRMLDEKKRKLLIDRMKSAILGELVIISARFQEAIAIALDEE